jgi:hypothetical protein
MDIVSIISIGGIVMITIGLIGGIDTEKVKIPKLPNWVRGSVVVIGSALLFLSIYIFPQSPFNPNNAQNIEATLAAFEITQTAHSGLATPTAVKQVSLIDEVLKVETIPLEVVVFAFDGPDPDRPTSLEVIYGNPLGVTYKHIFSFPDNAKAGAALVFRFDEPVDLSAYNSVEYTITFDSDPKNCEFYMADAIGAFQYVPCKEPFSSESGIAVGINSKGERKTTIPLIENYGKINMKIVKSLYFVVNPGAVEGQIVYKVSGIKFVE